MPKIPEFAPRNGIYPSSPQGVDFNPSNGGRDAEAGQRLGNTIADVTNALSQKRKEADDRSFAFQKTMEDTRDFSTYAENLRMELAKNDNGLQGFHENLKQYAEDRFQKNQDDASNEGARALYQESAGRFYTNQLLEADAVERKTRAEHYVMLPIKESEKTAKVLLNLTNPNEAASATQYYMEENEKAVKAGLGVNYDEHSYHKALDLSQQNLSKGFFDSLYNMQSRESLELGLKHLQGAIEPSQDTVLREADQTNGTKVPIDEAVKAGLITQQQADQYKTDGKTTVFQPKNENLKFGGATISRDLLTAGLTPDLKDAYIKQFQHALKQRETVDNTELHHRLQDSYISLLRGEDVPKDEDIPRLLTEAVNNKSMTPVERLRQIDNQNAALTTGQTIKEFRMTPPSAWNDIAQGWDAKMAKTVQAKVAQDPTLEAALLPQFNEAERVRAKDHIPSAADQIIRDRYKDPVDYIVSNSPDASRKYQQTKSDPQSTEDFVANSLYVQDYLEIPKDKQRIMTKTDSASLAKQLQSGDERQGAIALTQTQMQYGKFFNRAMAEMIADKKLPEEYRIPTYMQDMDAREKAVANIRNQKAIHSGFMETHKEYEKELDEVINTKTEDMTTALNGAAKGGGNIEQSNALRKLVKLESQKIMQTQNKSPSEAVELALPVVNSTYGVVKSGNSSVVVPRYVQGKPVQPEFLQAFMDSHLKADVLSQLDLPIPPELMKGQPEDKRREVYYKGLEKQGRWVTNKDQTGMALVMDYPGYQASPIKTKSGQPVEFGFYDISYSPDDFTLKAAQRGSFSKFLESVIKPGAGPKTDVAPNPMKGAKW